MRSEPAVRRLLVVGVLGAATFALSGCLSGADHSTHASPFPNGPLRGGTLRVGVNHPFGTDPRPGSAQYALDPQFEYQSMYWELYRCCLLRTLLSYSGQSTAQGGATVRPDLVAKMPRVSRNGLTWVFHLKRGLHYAPPFRRREIVAGDIVRALERELRLGANASYSFYYKVIEGASAFAAHKADSISGLEVPDPHTLVVHLTEPAGDLGYRFSLPATAPIPEGADRGHDAGYGRFLVSSGPYMVAGAEKMDFALPPKRQKPATGWHYQYIVRGGKVAILGRESLRLVRNPSWDPRTDLLRKAYPDRIELEMRGTPNGELQGNARRIDRDTLDVILDGGVPSSQLHRYQRSAHLRSRLHVNAESGVSYITMTLAVPPFDDLHIRRAVDLVLDRTALTRIVNRFGSAELVTPTEHDLPDSVEGGLLADYEPYPLSGDIAAAKAEMARSRYDRNHDGRCDVLACRRIVAYGAPPSTPAPYRADALVRRDLAQVGVHLVIRHLSLQAGFPIVAQPSMRVALVLEAGWLVDYPDAASFAPALQRPSGAANDDLSLLGATAQQLRRWRYRERSVPSVDGKIAQCRALLGGVRERCWAELDQLLTERIVPWVPEGQFEFAAVTSAHVARYSFDQFALGPALDRIALKHSSG
jgi:peptide/nickel transport system substrate-binding protein